MVLFPMLYDECAQYFTGATVQQLSGVCVPLILDGVPEKPQYVCVIFTLRQ